MSPIGQAWFLLWAGRGKTRTRVERLLRGREQESEMAKVSLAEDSERALGNGLSWGRLGSSLGYAPDSRFQSRHDLRVGRWRTAPGFMLGTEPG